jgi:hypothetical protein
MGLLFFLFEVEVSFATPSTWLPCNMTPSVLLGLLGSQQPEDQLPVQCILMVSPNHCRNWIKTHACHWTKNDVCSYHHCFLSIFAAKLLKFFLHLRLSDMVSPLARLKKKKRNLTSSRGLADIMRIHVPCAAFGIRRSWFWYCLGRGLGTI